MARRGIWVRGRPRAVSRTWAGPGRPAGPFPARIGGEGISPGSCLLRSEELCLKHALNNVLLGCESTRLAQTDEMFEAAETLAQQLSSLGIRHCYHYAGGCTDALSGAGERAPAGRPGRGDRAVAVEARLYTSWRYAPRGAPPKALNTYTSLALARPPRLEAPQLWPSPGGAIGAEPICGRRFSN